MNRDESMTIQARAISMLNFATVTQLWPGVLTALTIALAATFVAEH